MPWPINLHITHGDSKSPEYVSWCRMIARCCNPNDRDFKYYGGRGIRVCRRWRHYEYFLFDMGRRPTSKHTLGRKNNNGNYEPNNCEWQLMVKQNRNRRSTKLTIDDVREIRRLFKTHSQRRLAKMFNVSIGNIGSITAGYTWKGIK